MKIQKKLLFLICIAFTSASSYGMDDEYKKGRIEFFKNFNKFYWDMTDLKSEPLFTPKIGCSVCHKVKNNSSFLFINSKKPNSDTNIIENAKIQNLGKAIMNLQEEIIISPENRILTEDCTNHSRIVDLAPVYDQIEEEKSFWERYQAKGLLVGAIAAVGLLKLYNKWMQG